MEKMIVECNDVLQGLKIRAECVHAERHRHLEFYDLRLSYGCRVRKIEMFSREIALGLRSKTEPIITSIPELGIVRLRLARSDAGTIRFNEMYNEEERPEGILPFLLGITDDGQKLWVDMAMHPHTLIAGGTGSGKSTALHTIIANAVRRNDVWLYLVDPKSGMEFGSYSGLANFLATNYDETVFMLEQLHAEMERRNVVLSQLGMNSIEQNPSIFAKILVVIDEVADLMLYDSDKSNPKRGMFEKLLITLAQKSRASGIYMVLATQRPSVDIIKGTIKANFPARLACKVSSATDSKVILDRTGAESLLGRGDAILDNNKFDCARFQVAYTTPGEVINEAL